MSLLANSEIAGIRLALEVTLVHRYTRTRMADGVVENDWGDAPPVPSGASDQGIPCVWEAVERIVRSDTGVTVVSHGRLTVSATDPLTIGDEVAAITDQLSGTPPGAAGTFVVQRVADATAGLGASLIVIYELLSSRTVR